MQGRLRGSTRVQSQYEPQFKQSRFGGGQNSDQPPNKIRQDELALVENFVCFDEYAESRGGTRKYSDTALPGSGTVHSQKFHTTAKKWVLHRGSGLWVAGVAMSSWTEVVTYCSRQQVPTENGDASNQLSQLSLRGVSSLNSNAGTLYWNLTNSGSTRTLNIYKDSAKLNLVATGARVGDGFVRLTQSNDSGIGGQVTIAFTINDTDSANTFVCTTERSFIMDTDSTLRQCDNDFVLWPKNIDSTHYICYINLTDSKFLWLNSERGRGFGDEALAGSGSQAAATPYGTRILYTFCRITDAAGTLDSSLNRISGVLHWESAAPGASDTDVVKDYGEYWTANPIAVAAPLSVIVTLDGTVASAVVGWDASHHFTHLGIYRCLDIGSAGVDPVTGSGNNPEIYVWEQDLEITATTASLTKTDEELRAAFYAGFGLATRFWVNLPTGEVGDVGSGFLLSGSRGANRANYSQMGKKQHIGYYREDLQFFKLDDGLQIISISTDIISMVCAKKTYIASPRSILNASDVESVFVINHLAVSDHEIGVTAYETFVPVANGKFIALCSDRTVREFDLFSWGPDLSDDKVNKIVQTMVSGAVSGFVAGAYYLWYRDDTVETYNGNCLRLGMGGKAGKGWTKMTGAAWVYPGLNIPTMVILDTNGIQQLVVLDSPDSAYYWVAPFADYATTLVAGAFEAGVTQDKIPVAGTLGTAIAPKIKLRRYAGKSESDELIFQEGQVHYAENSAPAMTVRAYVDNDTVAEESIVYAANGSSDGHRHDIQAFKPIKGYRIQMEYEFSTTGKFAITGIDNLFQAQQKAAIGQTVSDSTEASNQSALAASLKHWLTRPQYNVTSFLNRANGTAYTKGGSDAVVLATGPDGKTYALTLVTSGLSQADTTSYSDFTVGFWAKAWAGTTRILEIRGANDAASFYVQKVSGTSISINGAGNVTIASDAAAFRHYVFARSGSTVTVYQDGVSMGTVTVAGAKGGVTFHIIRDGGSGLGDAIVFDVRVWASALSAAAIAYWESDVTDNTGTKVLPSV